MAGEMTAERTAQVDSILRIVNDSIEKLKISLILPRALENPITLRQYLNGTQYESCVAAVETYLKERKAMSRQTEPEKNIQMLKLIDLFHENHEMLSDLPNWLDDLGSDDKALLGAFELLQNIAEQRLSRSAVEELAKEKQIHQIYHDNEQMKKNITDFQNKLRNQRINLRWKHAAKDGVIKKYEEDLAFKKWDNNLRINEEIVKSNRRIKNVHSSTIAKQKELEEELEKTKANYEAVLKQNLHHEKEVRDEKNKLLLQLQALVRKFDTQIGEKIKENIYLQEVYDEQKRQFDEFFVEYQREEAEYDAIIRVKEEEERQRHEQRVWLFMANRAARIIQRAYRRYRKAVKKNAKANKGRKSKKK